MQAVQSHSLAADSEAPAVALLNEGGKCAECRDALSSAAHELKTPLAIMGGYLQLLLTEKLGPLTEKQIDVLAEMQESAYRLANFVHNFLAYASLQVDRLEMQYEMADMNACIRQIAEVWAPRFEEKTIAFYFLPSEKLPAFGFDWFKVQHVISNLLDNALKYTPRCGTVWMHSEPYFWERRAGQRKPALERRRHRADSPNCCRISVADTGAGIAPEYQQEIFEEYVRLTPAGTRADGHGLGLSIARKLVQASGGKIWVESEPERGSKFSFLILFDPPRNRPTVNRQ